MEHSEEIKKRMEQMEVRLDQYEQDFRSKKACSPGAAVSAVAVVCCCFSACLFYFISNCF